jgi:VanZ family protein
VADRVLRAGLQAALWLSLAACSWFALIPTPPDTLFQVSDVVQHSLAFGWLTFALRLAFPGLGSGAAGLWMLGYGAALEVVQGFGGVRSAEFGDFAVDVVAILVGLALFHWFGAAVRDRAGRLVRTLIR